jgi:hypothetical protein
MALAEHRSEKPSDLYRVLARESCRPMILCARRGATGVNAPLKGTVEIDTTFVGGKERNKHAADRVGGTQAVLARLLCSALLREMASSAPST